MELIKKSENYATGKANDALTKAIAQAYKDGYFDGYKDCMEEIPVDLRADITEYVDLGLPSGTLWSADYEKKGDEILYIPYGEANRFAIPSEEQWDELLKFCSFDYKRPNSVHSIYLCIGPNGNTITFKSRGFIKGNERSYGAINYFWIKKSVDDLKKSAVLMNYDNGQILTTIDLFLGYKLPIRLTRSK